MEMGKKYVGWTFYSGSKDYFIISDYEKKTEHFIVKILKSLGHKCSDENIRYLSFALRKATLEIRECSLGSYYEIYGDNFGGCGSFVNDGKTVVIELNK